MAIEDTFNGGLGKGQANEVAMNLGRGQWVIEGIHIGHRLDDRLFRVDPARFHWTVKRVAGIEKVDSARFIGYIITTRRRAV